MKQQFKSAHGATTVIKMRKLFNSLCDDDAKFDFIGYHLAGGDSHTLRNYKTQFLTKYLRILLKTGAVKYICCKAFISDIDAV